MSRRRRLLEAAKDLAALADSSGNEMGMTTNQDVLEVLILVRSKRPVWQTAGATGYKCKIRESKFRYYWRPFSHLKVAIVPTIRHDVLLSTDWCWVHSTQRHFQPPGSTQLLDITIDQTTFVQVTSVGEFRVADDTVGCEGETMHTGNRMVNLLELVEYAYLMEIEEFVAQGQMVESKSKQPCGTTMLAEHRRMRDWRWQFYL